MSGAILSVQQGGSGTVSYAGRDPVGGLRATAFLQALAGGTEMSGADDAWQLFLDQFSASKGKPKPLSKWVRRNTDPAAEGQPTCVEYFRTATTHLGEIPLITVKFEFPYSHATIFYNQQMITNRKVDNPDADYKPLPARTAPGPLGDLVRFVIGELNATALLDARDRRLEESAKTSEQIQGEATAKALKIYDDHKTSKRRKKSA